MTLERRLRDSSGLESAYSDVEEAYAAGVDPDVDYVASEEANGPSTSSTTTPQRGRRRSRGRSCSCGRSRSCGNSRGYEESRSLSPVTQGERWKTEAEPDILPNVPRFTPKRMPGVQPPLIFGKMSPLDIFSQYFDDKVLKILCENTNKNAVRNLERGRKFTWAEICPEEMKKYIGLLLYTGVMDLPKVRDFWRKKTLFHVPFPATVMSRDRFLTISCNLHISDPMEDAENDKKRGTEAYDCLHRVQSLLDIMRNSPLLFRHLRQLGFGACGTYREGRAGVPSTKQNVLNKRSPRGSIRWIRDDDLLFVKWMDTREMLGTKSVHRKTRKWYMTIFQHLLDIAVTNSFILHKELCAIHQNKPMTRQNFQELLAAQLTGVPLDGSPKERCDHLPVPAWDWLVATDVTHSCHAFMRSTNSGSKPELTEKVDDQHHGTNKAGLE
ncbi:Chimeric ERCC6-PGBD3 protein [Anabarilius grahami]|uniref:Chimeric ERCC6-PGBD3 protein n=1 Tax=Anabarilius grahami TaxID=495550 RepID=A0A3N0XNL7_ANAGA|nr:Chimeric ERCC6-PGBD3 protein [Anabarilius grahami]